ncbi:tetratricopeptide repeat protein [Rummeliibacillus sp. NPDC094406]|uniref:tetratricopeptide repeat protein n=1 Tax=Rummeliibacillus sp. NPDC094406 TaxID=3364511 RepID=UPI00382C77F0
MDIDKLKEEYGKLSEIIYFDESQYFREQTSSNQHVKKFIEDAEQAINLTLMNQERYFLYSALGYSYRVINEADQAIYYFKKCLNMAEHHPKRRIETLIRLGEAYKYADLHKKALQLFDCALNLSIDFQITNYKDFIFQHIGKCLMELGKIELAKEYLNEALKIREISGDVELIRSTQKVLDYLNN